MDSEPNTTSSIWKEFISRSHLLRIDNFSLLRVSTDTGKAIQSNVFIIGGHKWTLDIYPDGRTTIDSGFLSIYLNLNSGDVGTEVTAQATFSILEHNGSPSSNNTRSTQVCNFVKGTTLESHGFGNFATLVDLQQSELMKDDTLLIKCTLMVIKDSKLEPTMSLGVFPIPTPNLSLDISSLLQDKLGSDIEFAVGGETFKTHRCIMAAMSPVFKEQLYGPMKEHESIKIEDVEPEIFKSLLHFIYSDELPHGDVDTAKKLLAVAHRYEIERLAAICEDFLGNSLDVKNVADILILANRHSCDHLKEACLRCLSCPENFNVVALSEDFSKLDGLLTDPVGPAEAGQFA